MSTFPTGQSWAAIHALQFLRQDMLRLKAELCTEPLTEPWREHLLETIKRLQELADGHVLREVPARVSADEEQPAMALAVREA